MNKQKVEIVEVPINELQASEYNPRKHSEEQLNQLKKSITEFGLISPIICNNAPGRENIIIGGHFRVEVARKMKLEKVPVVYVYISDIEKEKELNLRLNKNQGEWDYNLLKEFNIEFLLETGFDDSDLGSIWEEILETDDDNFDIKEQEIEAHDTKIKTGDFFQLGNHYLICGDSTNQETVKKLLGNNKVNMIYSDPPFNISLDYNKGISKNKSYGGIVNDSKSDNEYREFISQTLTNALSVSEEDTHVFYYCDQKYIGDIKNIYTKQGINNRRICLWVKNGFTATPQVAFNRCYEPCIYGTRGKPYLSEIKNLSEVLNKEIGNGNRMADDILDMLDIWLAKRVAGQEYEHPTQKPITLHEKPITRCTKINDVVLDLFGGSGSTLIACEQLKRKSFLVEQSPIFCQLIINRFETYANIKAKQLN